METTKKILMTVIGVVVAVIITAAVLMPVLSDAVKTEDTFTNEGYYYMTDLGEQSIVYTFDGTKWTVDGEDMDVVPSDITTLIAGEEVIVRANGQIRGTTNLNPTTITSMTVTADGITGTAIVSGNSQNFTISKTIFYCAVNDKTGFVLSKYNTPTYLNKDSQILADGLSGYKAGSSALFRIEGSIEDGFTVSPTPDTLGITDVTCNYEVVDSHLDLYKVTSITFNSVYDNGTPDDTTDDVIRQQTYTSYVVPYEVTAERAVHFDPAQIAILDAIPMFVIVAILMLAAALIIRNRE